MDRISRRGFLAGSLSSAIGVQGLLSGCGLPIFIPMVPSSILDLVTSKILDLIVAAVKEAARPIYGPEKVYAPGEVWLQRPTGLSDYAAEDMVGMFRDIEFKFKELRRAVYETPVVLYKARLSLMQIGQQGQWSLVTGGPDKAQVFTVTNGLLDWWLKEETQKDHSCNLKIGGNTFGPEPCGINKCPIMGMRQPFIDANDKLQVLFFAVEPVEFAPLPKGHKKRSYKEEKEWNDRKDEYDRLLKIHNTHDQLWPGCLIHPDPRHIKSSQNEQ